MRRYFISIPAKIYKELKDVVFGLSLILIALMLIVMTGRAIQNLTGLIGVLAIIGFAIYYLELRGYLRSKLPGHYQEEITDPRTQRALRKIRDGEELEVEDIKGVFKEKKELSEDIEKTINDFIDGDLGNEVYRSVIEDAVKEVRYDLIEPSRDVEGFEDREKGSSGREMIDYMEAGFIQIPEKRPDNLRAISRSIVDYFVATGNGFNFDREFIYSAEKDYRTLLEAVMSLDDELEKFDLKVEYSKPLVTVRLDSENFSWSEIFETTERAHYKSLKVVEDALSSSKVLKRIRGQPNTVLILNLSTMRNVKDYISYA